MKVKVFFISVLLLAIIGCQSLGVGGCFTVAGNKGDLGGSLTYCIDGQKTQAAGVPTIIETQEDGEKRELFGIDVEQLQDIWDKLRGKEKEEKAGVEGDVSASAIIPAEKALNEPKTGVALVRAILGAE